MLPASSSWLRLGRKAQHQIRLGYMTAERNGQNFTSTFCSKAYQPNHVVVVAPLVVRRATQLLQINTNHSIRSNGLWQRALSSNTSNDSNNSNNKSSQQETSNNTDVKSQGDQVPGGGELAPMTPGEKVVFASRVFVWGGVLVVAGVCLYYIVKELMPTNLSANSIFNDSFELVRNNSEVKRRYGDKVKGYGKDHGGHREGRRNFVEHTEYVSQEDGSNRTRVRYNLEGRFGQAIVIAERSSKMPAGEFVFILVQDKQNGRVITIIDNRAALTAARLAGDDKEGAALMSQLLTGGKKN